MLRDTWTGKLITSLLSHPPYGRPRNGPTYRGGSAGTVRPRKIISAYGEQLPFGDREFDAVLSLWALNHVDDPRACVAEMIRVLKPGGVARLVLEDMQPTWSDFIRDGFRRGLARLTGSMWPAEIQLPFLEALRSKIAGNWPLGPDHIRIEQDDLLRWLLH